MAVQTPERLLEAGHRAVLASGVLFVAFCRVFPSCGVPLDELVQGDTAIRVRVDLQDDLSSGERTHKFKLDHRN